MTLQEMIDLARVSGTDKCKDTNGSGHSYIPFYYQELNAHRLDVGKVLEIGVGDTIGRRTSLLLWRDFFPNALIIGIDNDRAKTEVVLGGPICLYCADQSNPSDLVFYVCGWQYDLIIDDGSHDPTHQILTAKTLMRFLAPSGMYVIEDVNDDVPILEALTEYDCQTHTFDGPGDRLIVVKHRN